MISVSEAILKQSGHGTAARVPVQNREGRPGGSRKTLIRGPWAVAEALR